MTPGAAAGLTTADYALIVSICSAFLSLFSLGWNIWSKFIYPKPKVRISVDLKYAHLSSGHIVSIGADGRFAGGTPSNELSLPAIEISVANFGPGPVTVTSAVGKPKKALPLEKSEGLAIVTAYDHYPLDLNSKNVFGGGLPKTLDVGGELTLYFPVDSDLTGEGSLKKLGVRDSFSRFHWIERSQMKELRLKALAHREFEKNNQINL